MVTWKIIALAVVAVGLIFYAGTNYCECPEPPAMDRAVYDSLTAQAMLFKGRAEVNLALADTERAKRLRLEATELPTPAIIKQLGNAIRANGFYAAVDTLRKRPE